jgi:hypothetical protein
MPAAAGCKHKCTRPCAMQIAMRNPVPHWHDADAPAVFMAGENALAQHTCCAPPVRTPIQSCAMPRAAPVQCGRSRCFHTCPAPLTRTPPLQAPLSSAPADASTYVHCCGSFSMHCQCLIVLCAPRVHFIPSPVPPQSGHGGHYPTCCLPLVSLHPPPKCVCV